MVRVNPGPATITSVADLDQESTLSTLEAIAPGIAAMFGRACEVVVHDLSKPESSIVCIANGHVTGRRLGGPLVGGPFGDEALKWMNTYDTSQHWRVYETRTADGRHLKSMTAMFRDGTGRPSYALCVNLDLGPVAAFVRWADTVLEIGSDGGHVEGRTRGSPPVDIDVDEIVAGMIGESLARLPGSTKKISREARFAIVKELDSKGAFLIKGAVRQVARAVGVSKFTIYSDLDKLRSQDPI